MDAIGKYRIEAKLGQGGMGIVYKCRDMETGRYSAVKVLPQQLASDPVFFQRFKREVMTLRRLDHPNIVSVYEQGVHGGAPYYAMEYVEGVSLESLLAKEGRLDPLRALEIVRPCLEALAHSHSMGVIHRDIKPANIMITNDGNVKVMDFGIAKVLDATRMTATQGVLGTVEYMSPEQAEGRHVDARTDIYSLGVVLYRCLTGRLPISGTTPSEVMLKLRTQQIDPPDAWRPELPKNLSDLVMKLLEKDPSRRIESAQALLRELDRVERQIRSGITGRGPVAAPDRVITTGVAPRGSVWLSPWPYALALLAVVVLYLTLRQGQPSDVGDRDAAGAKRDVRVGLMLQWARRETERQNYALAADLCRLIIAHFPESPQTERAREQLQAIEWAQAARDKTGAPPDASRLAPGESAPSSKPSPGESHDPT